MLRAGHGMREIGWNSRHLWRKYWPHCHTKNFSSSFCRSELVTFIPAATETVIDILSVWPRGLAVDHEWKGHSRSHCRCHSGNIRRIRCFNGPAPNWQWTRSRVILINARSHICFLRWWIVEGAVAKCSVRVGTGLLFWLLLSYFPTGKRIFSTHTVVTSSGLHPASYPTDDLVFFPPRNWWSYIWSINSSSLRIDPLLWSIWIQSILWSLVFLKIHFNIILVSVEVLQFLRQLLCVFRQLTYMLCVFFF